MSWDEGLADRYDEWAAHMTEDIPFYVAPAREADGPVVEPAVGTGRVARPVARAIGRTVVGIDSSPAMLATVTDPRLDPREHAPTWAGRRQVFENVDPALKPGGRFAWNAFASAHRTSTLWWATRNEWPGLISVARLEGS